MYSVIATNISEHTFQSNWSYDINTVTHQKSHFHGFFSFMFKVVHILVKKSTALTLDIFAILNAPLTNHILGTNAIASSWKFK